jgi:hypothetical protein
METGSREESRSRKNRNQLSNILDKSGTFKESSVIFDFLETGAVDLCESVVPFAQMHVSLELDVKEII